MPQPKRRSADGRRGLRRCHGRPGWRPGSVAAAVWAATALGAVQAAPATPALGLIVRLKDAAAHDEPLAEAARVRQHRRWQAVLDDAALAGRAGRRAPALRAVGRDQQLLDFGHALDATEATRLAERLRRDPRVDWVAPNSREQALQLSADPLSAQQWWLKPAGGTDANLPADRLRGVPGFLTAWQSGLPGATGRAAAVVAVLDTGVTAHPDLDGQFLAGHDFVSDAAFANDGDGRDEDPADPGDGVSRTDLADSHFEGCDVQASSWHGTIVSGMLAAATHNGIGVAGINTAGRVLPVRVAGKCGATVADIVDGMRWAAGLAVAGVPANGHPARIVNISFGGSAPCGPEYQSAVDELRAHGVVVVAAAGNDHGAVSRPASCAGVVGVAALNRDGFKTHYSNFGSGLRDSGVATVGGDDSRGGAWGALVADNGLVSVWNDGALAPGRPDYAALFGTSFAAPLVAGTLSLMLSVNPALGREQLVQGLRLTARPHVTSPHIADCSESNPGRCLCTAQTCGAGIVDADQALRYAAHPDGYVPPPRQGAVLDSPELASAAALGPDRAPNALPAASAEGHRGGGASSAGWVLGVAVAAAALSRRRAGRRRD
jgi:serine protease